MTIPQFTLYGVSNRKKQIIEKKIVRELQETITKGIESDALAMAMKFGHFFEAEYESSIVRTKAQAPRN